MKAGDEIIIRLRVEKSNGLCLGCWYHLPENGCLFGIQVSKNKDLPCKGKNFIFKQIENLPEKSE